MKTGGSNTCSRGSAIGMIAWPKKQRMKRTESGESKLLETRVSESLKNDAGRERRVLELLQRRRQKDLENFWWL